MFGKNLPKIFLILGYIFVFIKYLQNSQYLWFMDNFNLLIHEAGHLFFMFFGEFIGVAGGTLFQILIPLATIFIFTKQQDYFAISFSFSWLGTNLFNIARYAADAQNMVLPLIHLGGGEPIHDWNYLLNHTGLILQTSGVADAFRFFGYLFLLSSIIWGILYLTKQRSS